MKPNAIERTIAAISPRWAMQRMAYRASFEMLSQARAYDAAKRGRRTDNWMSGGSSANAEIGPVLSLMRGRVHDLARNNPIAATIVRKLAAKTIGTGIMPRLQIGDIKDPRRRQGRDIWNAFNDNCDPAGRHDFYGLSNILARSVFEGGEALIRFLPRPASSKMTIPLQVEILEGDYIDSGKNLSLENGGAIIQGVEFDSNGRRVAYWLFAEHPGDSVSNFAKRSFQSDRVPADQICHVFETLRPGQARGVSIFTPVVLKLRDLDDYDDAELMRRKIAACFAAFVEKDAGAAGSPLAATTTKSAGGDHIETMRPGLIQYLNLGEKVSFGSPPSGGDGIDYLRSQLRLVAVGCGVTYEMGSGDLSQTNYSSYRGGMIDFWDQLDQWQWLMLIPQACAPVWRRVGQVAAVKGLRNTTDPWSAIWTPPARRRTDPEKEVKAEIEACRGGLQSIGDPIAAQGFDPEEKLAEIAKFNALLDELGITIDSDPRKVGRASAPSPASAQANPQS